MKHQTPGSMKFKKLARRLGLRAYEAAGLLELLWIATQKNAPRGDIGKFDNEEIAIELDWIGDADELVEALVDCGWLDCCERHRLIVHDWSQHAPRYVHGVVSKIGGFATVSDCSGALQSATVVEDCSGDCNEVQPNLTSPNQTEPNQNASRSCAEENSAPSEYEFPIRVGVSGGSDRWWLPQRVFDRYTEVYGEAADVAYELRKAREWLMAHPTRKKSAGGMQRFLTAWLTRAADKCRAGPSGRDTVSRGSVDAVNAVLARHGITDD